ncbi:MAG: hypothetical protein GW893_24500, partial [Armatimonadetes bacterium]|nr:hypothetical protein [Armatimonadota bacterium]
MTLRSFTSRSVFSLSGTCFVALFFFPCFHGLTAQQTERTSLPDPSSPAPLLARAEEHIAGHRTQQAIDALFRVTTEFQQSPEAAEAWKRIIELFGQQEQHDLCLRAVAHLLSGYPTSEPARLAFRRVENLPAKGFAGFTHTEYRRMLAACFACREASSPPSLDNWRQVRSLFGDAFSRIPTYRLPPFDPGKDRRDPAYLEWITTTYYEDERRSLVMEQRSHVPEIYAAAFKAVVESMQKTEGDKPTRKLLLDELTNGSLGFDTSSVRQYALIVLDEIETKLLADLRKQAEDAFAKKQYDVAQTIFRQLAKESPMRGFAPREMKMGVTSAILSAP